MKSTHHSETWTIPYDASTVRVQNEIMWTMRSLLLPAFHDMSEENFRTYDIEVDVMTMGTVATVSLRMWGGYDRNERPPREWIKHEE